MAVTSAVFKKSANFTTTRGGNDRRSLSVTMTSAHYDKDKQTIRVLCDDGNARECRVERLPSVGHGRNLWKKIQELGASETPVKFVSAGGFDPNRWFYTIEA